MGTCFFIYKYIPPDTTAKTAALVAAGTRYIFNRTNTLFNYGYGDGTPSMLHHGDEDVEICLTGRETTYEVDQRSFFRDGTSSVFHHEFLNKKLVL